MGVVVLLFAGCATQKTVPPLFTAIPQKDALLQPRFLDVPTPPEPKSFPIVIKIPKKDSAVTAENSIMRQGAIIKLGSSVVISVPEDFASSLANSKQSETSSSRAVGSPASGNTADFKTDEYFNDREQDIERGLIAVGFQAKDRSKFEAKLRDLRDSARTTRENSYNIALADLHKDLDSGKIDRDEFAKKAKEFGERLPDAAGAIGAKNRQEMADISEVIRAAQSGDVMADYVLQVNNLAVQHFPGTPLQLNTRPEIQTVLDQNPGLRVGGESSAGDSLPATLQRPWAQARFNAKLIEVKTGSIDWIGEYSIESLAVLENGITFTIGVRRFTSNGKAIVDAISEYNAQVRGAHQAAVNAKQELDEKYREVMQPVSYEGKAEIGAEIQNKRKSEVEATEKKFEKCVAEYHAAIAGKPPEAKMDWTYSYSVDSPMVVPDILNPKTEEEKQRLLEHVNALGLKVTRDLLQTIKMTKEGGAK